jgi:hypothetical protein
LLKLRKDLDIFHVVERQPLPYGEYPFTKYPLGWVKGMPGFTDPRRYPQWVKSFNESYFEHAEHYLSQALKKVEEKKSEDVETKKLLLVIQLIEYWIKLKKGTMIWLLWVALV